MPDADGPGLFYLSDHGFVSLISPPSAIGCLGDGRRWAATRHPSAYPSSVGLYWRWYGESGMTLCHFSLACWWSSHTLSVYLKGNIHCHISGLFLFLKMEFLSSAQSFDSCLLLEKFDTLLAITAWVIHYFNPLKPELNSICYLLALLGAHHFLHVSRIRVKLLTFRLLMSYIYGAPILDVSRSHTTTQHSR